MPIRGKLRYSLEQIFYSPTVGFQHMPCPGAVLQAELSCRSCVFIRATSGHCEKKGAVAWKIWPAVWRFLHQDVSPAVWGFFKLMMFRLQFWDAFLIQNFHLQFRDGAFSTQDVSPEHKLAHDVYLEYALNAAGNAFSEKQLQVVHLVHHSPFGRRP